MDKGSLMALLVLLFFLVAVAKASSKASNTHSLVMFFSLEIASTIKNKSLLSIFSPKIGD
jgi:hypothetical protein